MKKPTCHHFFRVSGVSREDGSEQQTCLYCGASPYSRNPTEREKLGVHGKPGSRKFVKKKCKGCKTPILDWTANGVRLYCRRCKYKLGLDRGKEYRARKRAEKGRKYGWNSKGGSC